GNAVRFEPPQLLGERAEHREVSGLEPRHVLSLLVRCDELGLDLLERHRRRVDDPRAVRAIGEKLARNDRAGIEADRAAGDQLAPPHRDEVGSAGTRADEMHCHDAFVSASAQVTGPTAIRGRRSVALGPPAASAAASATDGTPTSAFTRGEKDCVRVPAASRSAGETRRSGTPRASAAATIPGSFPLPSEVAMRRSVSRPRFACANASSIAASTSACEAPLRQPMPATIMA